MTTTPDYPVDSSNVTMGDTSAMDLGPLFDAVEAGRDDAAGGAPSAATWRDYADKLTAEQFADLASLDGPGGRQSHAVEALRALAEQMVQGNAIDAQYGSVAMPPGASTDGSGWARNAETGEWARPVDWATFPAAAPGVEVAVDGWQSTDGSFTRTVTVYAEDVRLSAGQARALAAVLLAAADELDRLDGVESTAVDRATLHQATVAEIVAEIGRRIDAAGGVLLMALAEADPAALTRAERTALTELLERAMDAGGT